MASTSSSSASIPAKEWKYDVFLSFRGQDTRKNFTSHLHAALCRNKITTFIDNNLTRGEEITSALLNIIEDSRISVIIFSDDYGSSKFCLDEVAKIIECHEVHGQIVIPVFYDVDPSDVENQTGGFAKAFIQHESEIYNFDRVQGWKEALSKASSMAGWDSKVTCPDSKLVDNIVDDILVKLNKECFSDLEGLVGIHYRIKEMKNLLLLELPDVRLLGIWGMGGIGKTTIAEAVFKQIARQFEGCCFLENVKDAHEKHGVYHLRKELLFQVSGGKDFIIGTNVVLDSSPLVRRMLNRKILLVVDDASNLEQLEFFVNNRRMFGKGSRILITSRDKQILVRCDAIYEVKGLEYWEALNLFSEKAFKESSSMADYWDLSRSFIEYANGNPLAIKILGSFLIGKSQTEWSSALAKLEKVANKDIQNVLKISYDSLDRDEKEIFLHIACFFKGEKEEDVKRILDACGLETEIGLSVLIDKSLVTISHHQIRMHDLLQEMGKEIVRQESKDPGERSRLWDHQDIVQVLRRNKGTTKIEAIFLDMSKIKEIDIKPNVFENMHNLKLLKFFSWGGKKDGNKVKLSRGLDYLPDELRYLYWHGYPLKTLPDNFNAELVELHFPCSELEVLPSEEDMNLENLHKIDLSHSSSLVKLPELSRTKNLVHINVSFCKSIRIFPSTNDLMSLETLDLSGCLKLEILSEVSRSIKSMDLSTTAIEELPASLGALDKLKAFKMVNCTKLKCLPSNFCKLKSLEDFDLTGCSSLEQFPEILETMDCLSTLRLEGTGIVELPSSIENLKVLAWLYLSNCRNLELLPENLSNLQSLKHISFSGCQELRNTPENLVLSMSLVGNGCHMLSSLSDLSSSSHIEILNLSDNRFDRLPESIGQLTQLRELDISFCDRLVSLPDLPQSLRKINAIECRSLETISNSTAHVLDLEYPGSWIYKDNKFLFVNCFKLDPGSWSNFLTEVERRLQHSVLSKLRHEERDKDHFRSILIYPGNEIPDWFNFRRMGNSIQIPFSAHSKDSKFGRDMAAICLVISCQGNCDAKCPQSCHIGRNCFVALAFDFWNKVSEKPKSLESELVVLLFPQEIPNFTDATRHCKDEFASFTFILTPEDCGWKVKKCGMLPIYAVKNYETRLSMKSKIFRPQYEVRKKRIRSV